MKRTYFRNSIKEKNELSTTAVESAEQESQFHITYTVDCSAILQVKNPYGEKIQRQAPTETLFAAGGTEKKPTDV